MRVWHLILLLISVMIRVIALCILFITSSCKWKQQQVITPEESEVSTFFPVTAFLKGQVFSLQDKGINPLKYTTVDNKTDSAWLKVEEIPGAVAPFLEIKIDSANLRDTFKETTFLDQTIDAYTFSYDPKVTLPDNYKLRRWDVYVNPETNRVNRVYIVRKENDHTTLQLTWQTNKFCKMVYISDSTGKPSIEKEILINWDF